MKHRPQGWLCEIGTRLGTDPASRDVLLRRPEAPEGPTAFNPIQNNSGLPKSLSENIRRDYKVFGA